MSSRDRIWLRVAAVWTFFVWVVFVRNLIGNDEHSFGFKAVHMTLAVVSIALGAIVWRVASRNKAAVRS
jgi:hypothetical protein